MCFSVHFECCLLFCVFIIYPSILIFKVKSIHAVNKVVTFLHYCYTVQQIVAMCQFICVVVDGLSVGKISCHWDCLCGLVIRASAFACRRSQVESLAESYQRLRKMVLTWHSTLRS